jgi:hypothetical protein
VSDRLTLTRALESSGMESTAAERIANAPKRSSSCMHLKAPNTTRR